jgi:hypothetical protein
MPLTVPGLPRTAKRLVNREVGWLAGTRSSVASEQLLLHHADLAAFLGTYHPNIVACDLFPLLPRCNTGVTLKA